MAIVNAYEEAAALCTALTLWKVGALPTSSERLMYDVLRAICCMAAVLLTRAPKFRMHSREWLQPDVQSTLLLHLLTQIRHTELRTENPKSVVNLLLHAAQNKLRDLHGFADRRKGFVVLSENAVACVEAASTAYSDLHGQRRIKVLNSKIKHNNKEA